ncbi:MAG: Fur family transcriptional regulator [Arenicella sp.]
MYDKTTLSEPALINRIEQQCQLNGIRLTSKRRRIMMVLLQVNRALSAYDIAEQYKRQYKESIPVMSAYRMLDFLTHYELAHKLVSINRYIACSHAACKHDHQQTQFLICNICEAVQEINASNNAVQAISDASKKVLFSVAQAHIELHGTCQTCKHTQAAIV